MKHLLSLARSAIVATLLLAVSPACLAQSRPLALAPGEKVPDLTGYTFPMGEPAQIDWADGKVTVVNFWATWCKPCRDEMPALQELHEKHKDNGLRIVGVFDPTLPMKEVANFAYPLGVRYPLLRPEMHIPNAWGGISVLPVTFVVDDQGTLLRRYVGARPVQTRGLMVDIEAALAGEPMPAMVIPGPDDRTDEPVFAPGR